MTERTRFLTDEQLGQFWQDGYIVLKNTLDPDVIEKSRDAILDMIPRDLVLPSLPVQQTDLGSAQGQKDRLISAPL